MTLTPNERREKCNPILIGACVGFISPLTSVIWGIRQRSWSLAFVPFLLGSFIALLTMYNTGKEELSREVKYPIQFFMGLISYEMTKNMKQKEINDKKKTIDIEKE